MKNANLIALLAMLMPALTGMAHEGHDHGAPPVAADVGWAPRASARSDDFDLVAAAQGPDLVLWLDRGQDNAPVTDARIEVEAGAWKGVAHPVGDGSYRVEAGGLARPGRHELLFTVQAGSAVDLLPAILKLPAAEADRAAAPASRATAALAGGAVLALAGAWAWRRRRAAS